MWPRLIFCFLLAASGCVGDDVDGGSNPDLTADTTPDLGYPFPTSTASQVIVEPSDRGAALVQAINGAQTSVSMCMYLLSSGDVIAALKARAKAGKLVKVILNAQFPSGTVPANPNTDVYKELAAANVQVHWAQPKFNYTHAKYFIVDGKTAWIMTMNATNSSPLGNREYLAVDTVSADVAELQAIFDADFAPSAIVPSGPLVVSPENAGPRLVSLIASAQKTVDVEVEELSDSGIVGALLERAGAGLTVHVVLQIGPVTSAQQAAIDQMTAAHIPIVNLGQTLDVHAKAIVVDGVVAYVGSQNFTSVSLAQNREIGMITTTSVKIIADTIAADFASGSSF